MFNFGSDDKEELQENMQEIKGMIQGDKDRQSDSGFDGFDGFDQESSGNNQGSQHGMNQGREQSFPNNSQQNDQNQGMNQEASQGFGNENNQNGFSENNNSGMNQRQSQTETDDFDPFAPDEDEQMESQVGQKVKVPGQSNKGTANTGPASQQISGPDNSEVVNPEGEENNSSSERNDESISRNVRNTRRNPQERNQDSNKLDRRPSADEPLFLREENFVDVREMIEEMGYLARELQENLDEMKETVHKEKEYARDAQEVVNAYSDRRRDIEDIIKTGEK